MLVDQRLRVMSGPDKGTSFQLPQAGSETLGRSRQHNEICLHDPTVGRVHCQVEIDDGHVFLSDFDSETGTFLNGTRITRQELTSADAATQLDFKARQGMPVPGVELRVLDGDGQEVAWDGKTMGELVARGPWVTASYYNDPRSAESFTADGIKRLEDLGVTHTAGGFGRFNPYGLETDPETLQEKIDNLNRYADEVITTTR